MELQGHASGIFPSADSTSTHREHLRKPQSPSLSSPRFSQISLTHPHFVPSNASRVLTAIVVVDLGENCWSLFGFGLILIFELGSWSRFENWLLLFEIFDYWSSWDELDAGQA
ncbi:hypothetical protein Droror1_Dr00025271, partial [Drosera rotundifolia]